MKYLYGASVQGIQEFIFQSTRLKEVVGASELVEEICTTRFVKLICPERASTYKEAKEFLNTDECALLNAAGNIKYLFSTKVECEKIVREFPKSIVEFAPSVTISQAVVSVGDDIKFEDAVEILEERLKTQRNKPIRSTTLGLSGILRSRQTGLPVVAIREEGYLDKVTVSKLYFIEESLERKATTYNLSKKAFGDENLKIDRIAFDIKAIISRNDWIAIIHADGNGLGNVVQKIGRSCKDFKEFSCKLDEATTNAAVKAYKSLGLNDKVIPIRPIVLGGDDFTVICRGDIAIQYAKEFIKEFENETERLLGHILDKYRIYTEDQDLPRLTACAGIAYIKSSFPFHYGYELAEELCKAAKYDAKDSDAVKKGLKLPQSCIMFHKVQGSYTDSYPEICARELRPQNNISFSYGPYYINPKEGRWTIDELMKYCNYIGEEEFGPIRSRIRNWISILFENANKAEQDLDRIKSLNPSKKYEIEQITSMSQRLSGLNTINACPAYDILAVHTINNQETQR